MKAIFTILATAYMLLGTPGFANAQKKKIVSLEAKAIDASRGTPNSKIKTEAPAIDKVETKSRGTCSIYFDNFSGLYVKVYVDGYYRGTLAPYGSFTVNVADGYTEIYCISVGGTRDWESSGQCHGKYNLNPMGEKGPIR